MSLKGCFVAPSAPPDGARERRPPQATRNARAVRGTQAAQLVFAPVRPGFVAACMVKSPDGDFASGAGKPGPVGHPESDKGNIFPMAGKRLRGDAGRSACLAGRESDRARDLLVATLSSNACVESNIFEFVMT